MIPADTTVPAPQTAEQVIADVVHAWHADHFHGLGLVLSADLTNRLATAREDLIVRLTARLQAKAPASGAEA